MKPTIWAPAMKRFDTRDVSNVFVAVVWELLMPDCDLVRIF